jgi:predicted O-methyltransferase YrrM
MLKRTPSVLFATRIADVLLVLLTAVAATWLKAIRIVGIQNMPVSRRVLRRVGMLPIRDHYYEPLTNPRHLRFPLDRDRALPGIDFNVAEQLEFLGRFAFQDELRKFPIERSNNEREFYYHNLSLQSGDAEYYYSVLRLLKPRTVIEIGSGYSTLMALNAKRQNVSEDPTYNCDIVCVEPYEQPWLEALDVKVIRKRVEELDTGLFARLERNDILFIDSSHVIRPQGDVLFEILELIPGLAPGVLVHVHDVFTPRDYLASWVEDEMKLWNEQYLLEAFLTCNSSFRIIGAVNFLMHHYPELLTAKCPLLEKEMPNREPGSFWMVRSQ